MGPAGNRDGPLAPTRCLATLQTTHGLTLVTQPRSQGGHSHLCLKYVAQGHFDMEPAEQGGGSQKAPSLCISGATALTRAPESQPPPQRGATNIQSSSFETCWRDHTHTHTHTDLNRHRSLHLQRRLTMADAFKSPILHRQKCRRRRRRERRS